MRRTQPNFVLILCFAVAAAFAMPAPAQVLEAVMSGAAESPAGDPDGRGAARLTFAPGLGAVLAEIDTTGISSVVTAAHVHAGAAGSNGGPVLTISSAGLEFSLGRATVLLTVDPALAASMLADPANFYVNVHTDDFSGGAVRGQLEPQTRAYRARMDGASEFPGPGDSDGAGTAVVAFTGDAARLLVALEVSGIGTVNAAHIHAGAAGTSGSPVVTIFVGGDVFVDGRLVKLLDVNPDIARRIAERPDLFYVNVHTTEFPGGAIRGQLVRVAMSGDLQADSDVSPADIMYLINYLFAGGPPPR